jgi:hypothetical protein
MNDTADDGPEKGDKSNYRHGRLGDWRVAMHGTVRVSLAGNAARAINLENGGYVPIAPFCPTR